MVEVVEHLTEINHGLGVRASALCPCTRQINPCLVLVQPRKARPDIIEKMSGT